MTSGDAVQIRCADVLGLVVKIVGDDVTKNCELSISFQVAGPPFQSGGDCEGTKLTFRL